MKFYKFLIKLLVILFFSTSQAALLSGELDFSEKSEDHNDNFDKLIEKDINNLSTSQKKNITDDDSKKLDYIIPKNSAIVASNLMEIVLDPDRKYPLPITLITELPVFAKSGKVVLPKKTLISGLIETRPGGDFIAISGAVYKGLNIEIPAEGKLIPAQIRPENYGQYITPPPSKNASLFRSLGDSYLITTLLGVSIANSYNGDEGDRRVPGLMLGILGLDLGIRAIATLSEKGPEKIPPLVEIRRNTVIIFETVDDIFLPILSNPKTTLEGQNFQDY